MSRYDKYDGKTGGFRAPLAADFPIGNVEKVYGVSLNASGQVVIGASGVDELCGVIVIGKDSRSDATNARKAGMPVDVMTSGEIVEFTATAGGAGTAGTKYYAAAADGAVSTTNTGKLVGRTVEGTRLVVRVPWAKLSAS